MKLVKISIFLFSVFVLFSLNSCNSNSGTKQPAGTHVHDDGSVHTDHTDEPAKPAAQENFKLEADSTIKQVEEKHNDHGHHHSDPNHKH